MVTPSPAPNCTSEEDRIDESRLAGFARGIGWSCDCDCDPSQPFLVVTDQSVGRIRLSMNWARTAKSGHLPLAHQETQSLKGRRSVRMSVRGTSILKVGKSYNSGTQGVQPVTTHVRNRLINRDCNQIVTTTRAKPKRISELRKIEIPAI